MPGISRTAPPVTPTFPTDLATQAELDAKVSDTAYDATSWNGVTDVAPSKNAVRDAVVALAATSVPVASDANNNIKVGTGALGVAGASLTDSVAIGKDALAALVGAADGWVAIGTSAFKAAITTTNGRYGVAVGLNAGLKVTTGYDCVYIGAQTAREATTGIDNSALGCYAMHDMTTGHHNTAVGESALYENLTGGNNVASGSGAGHALLSDDNVAVGYDALWKPSGTIGNKTTTGARNVAVGRETGQSSATQRDDMTLLGYRALGNGNGAVAIGSGAIGGAAFALAAGYATSATGAGSAAIGTDSGGAGASTAIANVIALGTVNHKVQAESYGAISTRDTTIIAGGAGTDIKIGLASSRDIYLAASTGKVILNASGASLKFGNAGMEQTTVGSAGAASALPATPTKFFKVIDSAGTTLVIPAYAAA